MIHLSIATSATDHNIWRLMRNETLLEIQERWKVDMASSDRQRYTKSVGHRRGTTFRRNSEISGGRRMSNKEALDALSQVLDFVEDLQVLVLELMEECDQ